MIRTRIVWSKEQQTARPILSLHQSKPQSGWPDTVLFCIICNSPITPIGTPSPSLSTLLSGYTLNKQINVYTVFVCDLFTKLRFTYYFQRHIEPAPPVVMHISRFCGKCFTCQTVDSCAFSDKCGKPRVGCCVRTSKRIILDSRVVATNLFIWISFRSNCSETTWILSWKLIKSCFWVKVLYLRHF